MILNKALINSYNILKIVSAIVAIFHTIFGPIVMNFNNKITHAILRYKIYLQQVTMFTVSFLKIIPALNVVPTPKVTPAFNVSSFINIA